MCQFVMGVWWCSERSRCRATHPFIDSLKIPCLGVYLSSLAAPCCLNDLEAYRATHISAPWLATSLPCRQSTRSRWHRRCSTRATAKASRSVCPLHSPLSLRPPPHIHTRAHAHSLTVYRSATTPLVARSVPIFGCAHRAHRNTHPPPRAHHWIVGHPQVPL